VLIFPPNLRLPDRFPLRPLGMPFLELAVFFATYLKTNISSYVQQIPNGSKTYFLLNNFLNSNIQEVIDLYFWGGDLCPMVEWLSGKIVRIAGIVF
jgi:hypothetical protein